MKRESSLYTVVSVVATVLFLLVSSFFIQWNAQESIFGDFGNNHLLMAAVSVLGYAFISFLLSYVNLRCFSYSSRSILIYGSYLMLVLSIPNSLVFSQYHLAAMLVIWAILYMFKFVVYEKLKYSHLFMALLCISAAAMLVPQLLLYLLLFVMFSFGRREYGGLRLFYTVSGAIVIPWIYLFAFSFLFNGPMIGEIFKEYFDVVSNISPSFSEMTVSSVTYYVAVLMILIRAMLYFMSEYSQRNRAQRVSISFSSALSLSSLVLMVLYFNPNEFAFAIPLFVPFTFSLFDYFKNGKRGESRLSFTLLFVMTIFFRVASLLGVS